MAQVVELLVCIEFSSRRSPVRLPVFLTNLEFSHKFRIFKPEVTGSITGVSHKFRIVPTDNYFSLLD